MSTLPVSTVAASASAQAKPAEPARAQLREAAQQFEAILLRQMLASARTTSFGGAESLFGKSDDTFREMRDARFAEIASSSGQLGFADAIERQLARHLPKDPS
ncbi:MAG: flagellar biosynthesis protein FlgJ [Sphingomonadales bacterium]|nr:MAG: flagellar biosynthesis protein FlgJ [Sphingomonadales bacterium]